jgi:hypothetical protein
MEIRFRAIAQKLTYHDLFESVHNSIELFARSFPMLSATRLLQVLVITAALFIAEAEAGELFRRGQRRIGNQNVIRLRRIQPSTKAARLSDRARTKMNVMSFNQSSPYEARLTSYNRAMLKYQSDHAKWEQRVVSMENRAQQKLQKQKATEKRKEEARKARDLKQLRREEARLAKVRARESRQRSTGGLFGRSSTAPSTDAAKPQDQKSRQAESFFSGVEETKQKTVPAESPGFFARLKAAIFGR